MNIFVRVGGAAAATGAVLYAFSNQSAEASAAKKQLQRRPSWEAKFDGSQQREAVAAAASALDEGANKRLQRRPSWAAKCVQLPHAPTLSLLLTNTHLRRFEGAEPSSAVHVRSLREEVTMLPEPWRHDAPAQLDGRRARCIGGDSDGDARAGGECVL